MSDWLTDFVEYGSYGEVSPRLLYWTGVATIAGALRRKVWFDQEDYQWTPNFYIVIVGPPGVIRKSTSIDIGVRLLGKVEGVKFGPEIVTWQSLIQFIAENKDEVIMPDGEIFPMSCVTIALSEFGTFFNAEERDLVDNLTNLWDGKLGTITKMTKTNGVDEMVNPFINIIAATTPKWMADNFPEAMVGGGFASRCIFLFEKENGKVIAYPKRSMPASRNTMRFNLIDNLRTIAEYKGEYELTEAAYEWGERWYKELRETLSALGQSLEAGFIARKQVHLHKLAMVISAARYKFPVIDVPELEEAHKKLMELEVDTNNIFGFVGQSKVTKAAREIVEIITREGAIERRELYRKYFFRTMTSNEFRDAVNSVIMSRSVIEVPGKGLTLRPAQVVRLVK